MKKLLYQLLWHTLPEGSQVRPERMNIHTSMSHAKRRESKVSEKDRYVSLLHPFSQEFTYLKEGTMKLVNNE